jgi:hypothetical protein
MPWAAGPFQRGYHEFFLSMPLKKPSLPDWKEKASLPRIYVSKDKIIVI